MFPSQINIHGPTTQLSVFAEALESLINSQIKHVLTEKTNLSNIQSGFNSGHSTVTAPTIVVKDAVSSLDEKQHGAAAFVYF